MDRPAFDADNGFRAEIGSLVAACLGREAPVAPVATVATVATGSR